MTRLGLAVLSIAVVAVPIPLVAHPAPFSYADVRIEDGALDVTISAHIFDLAHDLGIDPPDRLLDVPVLRQHAAALADLIASRFTIEVDSELLTAGPWTEPDPIPDQQLVRFRTRYAVTTTPGRIAVAARLFPYDPAHQTFVNLYERNALTSQQILDVRRPGFEYVAETPRGILATARRFASAGVAGLLNGREHVLFVIGLLLLGGTLGQLTLITGAFAAAHSAALSLAAWGFVNPPLRIVAPTLALSVVYVGIDNLMIRGGRDLRVWVALAFGAVHGFGLANAYARAGLAQPGRGVGWRLYSFNAGVELGMLLLVAAVLSALSVIRQRKAGAERTVALAGSAALVALGVFWFVERLWFPGAIS